MSLRRTAGKKRLQPRPPADAKSTVWKVVKGSEPTAQTYHPAEQMTAFTGLKTHMVKDARLARARGNLQKLDQTFKTGSTTQGWYRKKLRLDERNKLIRLRKERREALEAQEAYILRNDLRDKGVMAKNKEVLEQVSAARREEAAQRIQQHLTYQPRLYPTAASRRARAEELAQTIPDYARVPKNRLLSTRGDLANVKLDAGGFDSLQPTVETNRYRAAAKIYPTRTYP